MTEQLSKICLELDPNVKSLKKDAIGQLLIRILCQQKTRIPKSKLWEIYRDIIKCDIASQKSVYEIIDELKSSDEIKSKDGLLYVSNPKRVAYQNQTNIENERKKRIIEKYFSKTYTSKEIVEDWLHNIMISFFKMYSQEWISDLQYSSQTLLSNKKSILETIRRKTENDNRLTKDDIPILLEGFSEMLADRTGEVASFLWTYGTTQFAAQLIKNGKALDNITINTFAGTTCLLDTNILMNLGLEGSEYYNALNLIEKAFSNLNISVKYLHITKEEYVRTVHNKKDEILNLVEQFEREVLKNADDQYLRTAYRRRCTNVSDFERFFSQIEEPPTVLNNIVRVSLLDNDRELVDTIERAQHDERLLTDFNNCYRSLTERNKRENALIHDVGLIAGVNFLRNTGKYFILSQDTAINRYSKNYPFKDNLPLAIKVDTLLNVLALSSYSDDDSDYVTLFADLIRMGLTTNRDKFTPAELSFVMERHQQFLSLPPEGVIRIGKEVHRMRLEGGSDEQINKNVIRLIQGEKIYLKEDLDATKRELQIEKKNKNEALSIAKNSMNVLEKEWKKQSYKQTERKIHIYLIISIGIPLILGGIIFGIGRFSSLIETIPEWIISIVCDVMLSTVAYLFGFLPKIKDLKKNKDIRVKEYIENKKRSYSL